MEDLRYNKIVIATDADVDGSIFVCVDYDFFANFFPRRIKENHLVYFTNPIIQSPVIKNRLFIVIVPEEKQAAMEALSGKPEIKLVWKGRGDSPDELPAFYWRRHSLEPVMLD